MGFEHRRERPDAQRPPLTAGERAWAEWRESLWQYRVVVFGRPVTAWADLETTRRAAIRLGHGSVCERSGRLYMTVPADIQRWKVDPPPRPPHEPCCSTRPGR